MIKRLLGLSAALLAACGAHESPQASSGESAGSSQHEFRANLFGVHLPGTNHAEITENALPFLDEDLLEDLGELNEDTDSGDTQYDNTYHVDNCRMAETFESIRGRYEGVVAGIKDGFIVGAVSQFGKILHTTQDFYAHSNWVDVGQPGLVTDGYPFEFPTAPPGTSFGVAPASVVALEEPLPADWSVSLPANSRSPVVTTPGGTLVGLITGTYSDNTQGSACPAGASIPHGDLFIDDDDGPGVYLSKDDPDSINHDLAKNAAISQTTEEFCRWARLVLLRYGRDRYEGMLSNFVDDRSLYEAMCPNARGVVTAAWSSTTW